MKAESTPPAPVSPQMEEYLEAICRIRDRRALAGPTELAHELGVAPPSVLGMLLRMEKLGLIGYARSAGATLTKRGSARAARLRRRHRLAERMLTDLLRMPWERAHEAACRFEHVIDDEVERLLQEALHHPATCPHGNPLDPTATRSWTPLATLGAGQSGRLRQVIDESSANLGYLRQIQLLPGTRVTVCSEAPDQGPLTVEVKGTRHALARSMAECLLVEKEGSSR